MARRYGRLPRDGHEDVRPPPHPAPYSFEERFHSQRASQRIRSARSDSDENWAETQSLYVPGLALTRATVSNDSAGVPPANVAAPTDPTEISVPRRHRFVNPDTLIGRLLRVLPFPCIVRPYGRLRGNGLQDPGLPSFPLPAPTALSGHGIADRTENSVLPAPDAQVVSSSRGAGRSFRTFRTPPPYGFLPTSPENAPVALLTGSALDIGEPTAPPTAAVAADSADSVSPLQQTDRASSPYPELHDLPDYEDTPSPRHATVGVAAAADATPDEPLSRFVSYAPADGAMRSALTAGGTMAQLQARQERRAQAERMRLQRDFFGLTHGDASVSPFDIDIGRLWWDSPTMLSGRATRR
jgi:rRNA maturation protein Nop10